MIWRVDWIANNGHLTPMTLLCDSEEHALAEEAAMRRAGKRDVVAWLDSESVGPWVAGDVPESNEKVPQSAAEVEMAQSYTAGISRPSDGDFGAVA